MLRRDRSQAGRKWWITAALLVVAYAVVVSSFVLLVCDMGNTFVQFELQSEFLAIILLCALMVVLIFGVVTVLTCLYFSKDTEFFLALPIRTGTVFAAKLAVVYVMETAVTLLLLLPCLVAAGITMHLSALFYVLLPFAVLLTPAVPLFLASIVAIPIMYVVSFFKNKGALGSVLVIVLFGAFFVLYYFGVSKMQNMNPEEVDLEAVRGIFVNIANTVYPLYALARAMALVPVFGLGVAASAVVNLLICFGSIAALAVIAMLISSAVYRRGAAAQLEGAKRTKATDAEYRSSGVLKALMKKEWREIIRTPAFALNCLLGIVMCPIVVAFVGFSVNISSIASEAAAEGAPMTEQAIRLLQTITRLIMLAMIMFMSAGTNAAPSTAFSREGEKFYYTKLLPVDYYTQTKAKSYVYMLIGVASSWLGTIAMAILQFDLSFFLCSMVFLPIFVFACTHFGMLIDIRRPKLKWTTPNEAIKHNRNVMISVFLSLFVAIAIVLLGGGAYYLLFTKGHEVLGMLVLWLILFAFAIAASAICYVMLYGKCNLYYESVEC